MEGISELAAASHKVFSAEAAGSRLDRIWLCRRPKPQVPQFAARLRGRWAFVAHPAPFGPAEGIWSRNTKPVAWQSREHYSLAELGYRYFNHVARGRRADGKMNQLFIVNEKDLLRCRKSMETQWPLLITGLTIDGHLKTFRGTVQSIDENRGRTDAIYFTITLRS